jgi:hypothetical protein
MRYHRERAPDIPFVHLKEVCRLEKEVSGVHPFEAISLAALEWAKANQEEMCDVVHVHEWGGAFADLVTAHRFGALR